MATEILGPIVAQIAVQLGKKVLGDDNLVGEIGKTIGSVAGSTIQDRITNLFSKRAVELALSNALAGSLDEVGHRFPEFIRTSENFTTEFLKSSDVAGQLANVFVRGQSPNTAELLTAWVSWYTTSGSPETIDERRVAAIEPMQLLVTEWTSRTKSLEPFAEQTARVDIGDTADAAKNIADILGASDADDLDRERYLRRLVLDHETLETTGTGTGDRRVRLESVFVSLSAVEDRQPLDQDRRDLDERRAALEAELDDGSFDAVEFEQRLDALLGHRTGRQHTETKPRPLGDVAATHDQVVVLGDPGSGKTTMMRWLALRHAKALLLGQTSVENTEQHWAMPARFPIYIRAGSLVDLDNWRALSLEDFIYQDHKARSYPSQASLRQVLTEQLERGQCLVLFDAMDEIPSADDRRDVAGRIQDFVRSWSPQGNRFMVTSRFAGYRAAPVSGFAHFQAVDMTPTQVTAFLESYCEALERTDQPDSDDTKILADAGNRVERIQSAIKANPGVARMAVNPLLLTILVLVQRSDYEIPTKRAGAYQKAAFALERGWRIGQRVDQHALPDEHLLKSTLAELAWWTHRERPAGVLTFDDILTAIGPRWAEQQRVERLANGEWPDELKTKIQAFIDQVEQHCGLINQKAPQRWGFLHQTFQEYYVARYLHSQRNQPEAIRRQLHNPRYHEPILLALGIITHVDGNADAAKISEAAIFGTGPFADNSNILQPADYEELLHRDQNFAYAAAADDIELPPQILHHLTETAITQLTTRNEYGEYPEHLTDLGRTKLGAHLAEQLSPIAQSDTDSDVRSLAAQALGQLGDTSNETLEVLRSIAQSDTDSIVRSLAAHALGQLEQLRPPWPLIASS